MYQQVDRRNLKFCMLESLKRQKAINIQKITKIVKTKNQGNVWADSRLSCEGRQNTVTVCRLLRHVKRALLSFDPTLVGLIFFKYFLVCDQLY